jgi:5-methylthioadenosine/S-adenosylhomocysteine deaminase
MEVLLSGATILTLDAMRQIIVDGAVCIRNDRILEVGPRPEVARKYPDAIIHDLQGKVLIPGLINTHTHLFQCLLKGRGDDRSRSDWGAIVRSSATALSPEDVLAGAMHGCVESIKSGVTTLVDFSYGNPREETTEPVVQAMEKTGLRGIVGRGYVTVPIDGGGDSLSLVESSDDALAHADSLIKRFNGLDARVQVALAPSMLWGVDEVTLAETRGLATRRGVLIMIHVSETAFDVESALARFHKREVVVLESLGLLGPDVLAVHCVHCSASDIEILKTYDVKVSHNPSSNLYLGAGIAPIPAFVRNDVTVGLGTDGAASNNNLNLIQTLRVAALIHRLDPLSPSVVTRYKVLEMATIDAARAIGLDHEVGSIEPGKKADMAVLDLSGVSTMPSEGPVSSLIYSSLGHEVESVWIDGKLILDQHEIRTVSESEVIHDASISALNLGRRSGTLL